jgi:hypothetical protein
MAKNSDDDDGFLSRWSRRKRGVALEADAAPEGPPQSAEPAPLPTQGAQPPETAEAGPPATETQTQAIEDFIEPPSLDIIDKDFDLAHWMKQNVPDSWKLAALRRTWETDPFIHGYLNPARDYALDWNTPGGAPGYGPLTESDDVKAMVARIFGDLPQPEQVETETSDSADFSDARLSDETKLPDFANAATQPELLGDPEIQPSSGVLSEPMALQSVRLSQKAAVDLDRGDVALQQERQHDDPGLSAPRQRRRSGGAIPV